MIIQRLFSQHRKEWREKKKAQELKSAKGVQSNKQWLNHLLNEDDPLEEKRINDQLNKKSEKEILSDYRKQRNQGDILKKITTKDKSRLRLDKLDRSLGNFAGINFVSKLREDKPNTNLYKIEAKEDFKKGLRDASGASGKKKKLVEKADEYEKKEAERKAKKAAESKASIAKHEAKAAELRAKKEAGEQLKKNLKKSGKIALATGGVVAAGIGAKKLADKKKDKKDSKEKES